MSGATICKLTYTARYRMMMFTMKSLLKMIMTTKILLQLVIIIISFDARCVLSAYPSYIDQLRGCENNGPLGMITGHIQDWQITASSTYPRDWDKACHERFARVYQPNGVAWCAKHKSASEWLQVDLGIPGKVTGLMTQGRGDGTEWVVAYQLSYSLDAFHWQYIYDQYGNQRVFDGNTDSYHVKHVYLDQPIIARYIKFHTARWNRHPSMRVEIIGCQVCNSFVALPPYGKLTASSERNHHTGSSCQAEDGHLLTQKGWCAKESNNNQWLQFDVGPPTLITGFVTKGRGEPGRRHWVTRYRLSYSNDTSLWFFYKDATHLDIKRPLLPWNKELAKNVTVTSIIPDRQSPEGLEFGGNVDKDTARYHYLTSPFVSRYVRFHPVEWNTHIGMRAGLIGCPHQGNCGPGFLRVVNNTPCVENLAYKKESWINNKRQLKRHVRNQWTRGQAGRAVDGDANSPTCTVLDNYYVDKPTWMVDLGKRTKISGVQIITSQGKNPVKEQQNSGHIYNLDKLTIYVDNKGGKENVDQLENTCGFISRVNDAIFQAQLHVQCSGPIRGRYVYVEATGVATRWTKLFSAVICEVLIYE